MPGKATQAVKPISLKIWGHNIEVHPQFVVVDGLMRRGNYELIYGLLKIGEYEEALRILLPIVEEVLEETTA